MWKCDYPIQNFVRQHGTTVACEKNKISVGRRGVRSLHKILDLSWQYYDLLPIAGELKLPKRNEKIQRTRKYEGGILKFEIWVK
jgi:hypothetical protein